MTGNPKRRDHRHWSVADDARLYELWHAEASTGAIARTLGRSPHAVLQHVENLRKRGVNFPYRHEAPKAGWVTRKKERAA